jgi:hypothetical protein
MYYMLLKQIIVQELVNATCCSGESIIVPLTWENATVQVGLDGAIRLILFINASVNKNQFSDELTFMHVTLMYSLYGKFPNQNTQADDIDMGQRRYMVMMLNWILPRYVMVIQPPDSDRHCYVSFHQKDNKSLNVALLNGAFHKPHRINPKLTGLHMSLPGFRTNKNHRMTKRGDLLYKTDDPCKTGIMCACPRKTKCPLPDQDMAKCIQWDICYAYCTYHNCSFEGDPRLKKQQPQKQRPTHAPPTQPTQVELDEYAKMYKDDEFPSIQQQPQQQPRSPSLPPTPTQPTQVELDEYAKMYKDDEFPPLK